MGRLDRGERKNRRKRKMKLVAITLICVFGILGVFAQIGNYAFTKHAKDKSNREVGAVNDLIQDKGAEQTGIYASNESTLPSFELNFDDSEIDESLIELQEILPVLQQGYENVKWDELFQKLNMDKLDELKVTTNLDLLKKQEKLLKDTGHDKASIQFHNISKVGDKYICPVSVVGIEENTGGNIVYDYNNVIETTFTVYKTDDSFLWLPFNVMFGVPVDEYSVVIEKTIVENESNNLKDETSELISEGAKRND